MQRIDGRARNDLRFVSVECGVNRYAEGSCLYRQGNTEVLVTASVEQGVPAWMADRPGGWLTAEYAMLPRANRTRTAREAKTGRQNGRTMEIQRLIGRSLRAAVDLASLDGLTVTLDCDVLQADGGTRCASITAGWIALHQALTHCVRKGTLPAMPSLLGVAAVSVGLSGETLFLDLDYREDASADVDLNLVMRAPGDIVEVQGTAEGEAFGRDQLDAMLDLGQSGIEALFRIQREAIRS